MYIIPFLMVMFVFLLFYQVDVIESQFSRLQQKIEATRDFEVIALAHEQHVTGLHAQAFLLSKPVCRSINEEQIITGYPIDGAMGSSGGGRVQKLSVVCLHNNTIVARGILVTTLQCGTPEPRLSTIYIVSFVGTSLVD